MGETLQIADERRGYTLTDRGTWLALSDRLDLPIVREGDAELLNVYHVITVNPANGRAIDAEGGKAFLDFVLSPDAQALIAEFGVDRFGAPLFTACPDNACGAFPATPAAATPTA
jgi:tungstate transport system substrate-binding protein